MQGKRMKKADQVHKNIRWEVLP